MDDMIITAWQCPLCRYLSPGLTVSTKEEAASAALPCPQCTATMQGHTMDRPSPLRAVARGGKSLDGLQTGYKEAPAAPPNVFDYLWKALQGE